MYTDGNSIGAFIDNKNGVNIVGIITVWLLKNLTIP